MMLSEHLPMCGLYVLRKAHIPFYTRSDGTPVAAHEDKRPAAKPSQATVKESLTVGCNQSAATRAAYEGRIDDLFAGKPAGRVGVRVLDRSDVLGLLGYPDKPVVLQESKVIAGKDNHPHMTAAAWKKVPKWLDDPAAVFKSDTVAGRLVFIAPEYVNNSPVVMVVEPKPTASGGTTMSVSLLVNAYDSPRPIPFARWMRDQLLQYAETKKFPAIFAQSVGRRLPDTAFQNRPGTLRILNEKHLSGYRKANPAARDFSAIAGTLHSYARSDGGDALVVLTHPASSNPAPLVKSLPVGAVVFVRNDGGGRRRFSLAQGDLS